MTPDLTARPPRSPHARLGGYVLLPRLLDKARAARAGRAGAYNYDGPLDQPFFRFTGLAAADLAAEVAKGGGDGELLAWVQAHARPAREAWEIERWSEHQVRRGPDGDAAKIAFFATHLASLSASRQDVHTWFGLVDLDDHVAFGGPA